MWLKWILLFCIATPVWAFRFTADFQNGFYWSTLPLNITVIESDASRKAMLEELSQAAITDWEDSTNISLWDYVGSGTKNIIRWSKNFAQETKMDPQSVLAVAIRYTEGPYFAKTEIVINGEHTYNQNEALLRTTITHELGHTMGLDHSDVEEAVMAPTLQPWYVGLHNDDIEGLQAANNEIQNRQLNRYVSPLAYEQEVTSAQPLSCGTVASAAQSTQSNVSGLASLLGGILISLVRKVINFFKSLL